MKLLPINLYNYSLFNKWFMNKFIQHLPCPQCGSKDNLGEYQDNYFCFGCGYYKRKNSIESLKARIKPRDDANEDGTTIITADPIPLEAVRWLNKYGITNQEIEQNGIGFNAERQLLILIQKDGYWQGRNFGTYHKAKYLSSGKKTTLTLYGESDKLVVVEDVLSAIKVSRLSPDYSAMPLLGSYMSPEWSRIVSERFKWVRIWLDRDKAKESLKMARNLSALGIDSRSVITELDPKEYGKEQIKGFLNND